MSHSKSLFFVCVLVLAAGLAGCSKHGAVSPAVDNKTQNLADAASPHAVEPDKVNALPQGDANTPDKDYRELSGDSDVMFTYYALSNLPVDYDTLLTTYSQDYRGTSDEFKKQDMQKALKPKIDLEIANAKSNNYVKIKWGRFYLEQYDPKLKGFPQTQLTTGASFGWGSYRMDYTNSDNFKVFKVEDEGKARQIEGLRSKNRELDLIIYAFVQDVELNSHNIKVQILKLVLQDENGNELLTLN